MFTYYKDQHDGYYVIPPDSEVTIPDTWIEISKEEYLAANPNAVIL